MRRFHWFLAALALPLFASGCIVVSDDAPRLDWYDVCGYDSDCPLSSDGCFDVTVDYGSVVITDAICTGYCRADYDCPFGGACLSLSGEPAICYQRCDRDYDCAPGFACLQTDDGTFLDYICLPN